MAQARVGQRIASRFRWRLNGVAVTTGSVDINVLRSASGNDIEYLQSDLTTWTTTPHDFSATLDGDYWTFWLTVPESADNHLIEVQAFHSDSALKNQADGPYYVTRGDTDHLDVRLR